MFITGLKMGSNAKSNVNKGFTNNPVFRERVYNNDNIIESNLFLKECVSILITKVGQFVNQRNTSFKLNCMLACKYITSKNDVEVMAEIIHNSKVVPVMINNDIKLLTAWYSENVCAPILQDMREFQEYNRGTTLLKKIMYLQVNVSKSDKMNSSRSSYISLPSNIRAKRAVINIKNNDERCFVWSVLSALFPATKNFERTSSYRQEQNKIFDLSTINFPTPLSDIPKFEEQNNVSINVYGLKCNFITKQSDIIGPLYYTSQKKERHVNLLYWKQRERSHYAWIKSLSRLVSSQLSHNDVRIKSHYEGVCDRCIQKFRSEELLKKHEEDCRLVEAVKIQLPSGDKKWLKFNHTMQNVRHPFVIYADFESFTVPISTCQPDPSCSYTYEYQRHVACAVAYQIVCSYDKSLSFYNSYCGVNAAKWFVEQMKSVTQMLNTFYNHEKKTIQMTQDDLEDFSKAVKCHICEKEFRPKDNIVRNYSQLTGKFCGAAHSTCKTNYQLPKYIPIFFHNLSGYDSHLIVRELGADEEGIYVIPSKEDQYISFSKSVDQFTLRFVDSFKFMNSSLAKLASDCSNYNDGESMQLIHKAFTDRDKMRLAMRKGVFPYDYVNSWSRLNETQLPDKDKFFSLLKNEGISDEDYKHAHIIWNTFNHKTLKDYLKFYLKTDVLLLADIFENFRDICLKTYDLDPAHYYTVAGFSWDAMLKITGVELELLTDIDMVLFFERGIRGDINQCSNRYSHANNEYMSNSKYDSQKPEKYLMNFNACNLNNFVMSQCLPHSDFRWLTTDEISQLDVTKISDNSENGYVFEVDLEYTQNLHNKHKDFPLCPEQHTLEKSNEKKLLTTLYDKKKYIIHHRNLRQVLELGLKIKKIYRAIKFQQSFWLKKYVDLNTKYAEQANNDFVKTIYKSLNNAVYGKSKENLRNRRNMQLFSKKEAQRLIAHPNFKKIEVFNDNLASVEFLKQFIKFDKPIYFGMAIQDISKYVMYDFFYNYIHKIFPDNKLMYMDTNGFILEILNTDPYKQIRKDSHKFDTSSFPIDNINKISQSNKCLLELFKDVHDGQIMTEFVGLCTKMYSFTLQDEEESHCRARGISTVVTKILTIDDFKNTLFENKIIHTKQKRIRSTKHIIFSVEENNLTLSADDDSRYILPNLTDTIPWGHYYLTIPSKNINYKH